MNNYEPIPRNVIDAVRMLSLDAVEQAKSGHPGTPMGASEMMLVLWTHFLRFHPGKPSWRDRDRFVLSVGHASMLLYSLLYLFGYDVKLDDLKRFRQLDSPAAGHPEYGLLPGVETTTGPLGQGVGNALGIALGQALLMGKFNQGDQGPVQGRIWCLCGDGCMMEGITAEAASLAGHLELNNLTLIYDKNDASIDGSTELSFTEDVGARFSAYGWQVLKTSAYDQPALCQAFDKARCSVERPTLIIAQSVIGRGAATMEGSSATHGQALGAREVELTKRKLGWPYEPFFIPEEVHVWCRLQVERKMREWEIWDRKMEVWRKSYPDLAEEWERHWTQPLRGDFGMDLARSLALETAATRKHSGRIIQSLAQEMPWLVGGSADLTESNCSPIKAAAAVRRSPTGGFEGRNIFFGVREHAMAAVCNGLALHGAWRPYGATFLQFADYMRPSLRLAALMQARSIFIFTHDSIFLGEDGPTHQPVEHLSTLRLIPGFTLWRPSDGLEVAMAWSWIASQARGPVALVLTRQNVAAVERADGFDPRVVWRGGYILHENPAAELTLIATGSELGVAVETAQLLAKGGLRCRVVSLPSVCVFNRQDDVYRAQILGSLPCVVLEAGSTPLWHHYVGADALVLGLDCFGLSAPAEDLAHCFGLTAPQVAVKVQAWMASRERTRAQSRCKA